MRKKLFASMLAVSMVAMMMAGCGKSENKVDSSKEPTDTKETTSEENNSELTPVTMASNPFVGLAPFYVAMEKGFFEECGLDFSLVDFEDSSASCSALLADKVDLAYVTLDAAVIAESQYDEDMLNVTSIVDESAGADGILVKNDIQSISDLKGKTVGVSINQTSHYLLLQALEKEGLTDTDVTLVNMTSSDAGVSFISGGLDAAVTWEPYLSNAVNEGAGKIIFSSADAPGSIMDVLVVGTENQSAKWMTNVKKAIQMGLDYLNNESTHDESLEIASKYLEVSSEETEAMLSTIKLYTPEESVEAMKEGGLAFEAVNKVSDFYLGKEIITKGVAATSMFAE